MKTIATIAASVLLLAGFAREAQADVTTPALLTYSPQSDARITALVSLGRQEMELTVVDASGQAHLFMWRVSTGRAGFETPTGTWSPTWMDRNHISKTYDDASMPFAVFFTGGYAVHATDAVDRLGRPASHGCIRLAPKDAEAFFTLVRAYGKDKTTIIVENE